MKNQKANEILENILSEVAKNGIDSSKLISPLKEARELALKENDPLVTRALRLTWQHLEENNGFEVAYLEDAESQEENLEFLISLCLKCEKEINREELRAFTNMLQEVA